MCPPSRWPPADAANSSNASGLPCASSTTPRRTRVGRCTNWRVSNSIASASGSGAMANSGNPARSKNPPTPGRVAPRSPIRLPRNRRPTNATTAPLARSSQCKSSTTMSSGWPDAACRNSASDALNTARRSGAGPEPMPSATSSTTRLRPRQTSQIVGQRIDELVEAGEADVRLVLHAAAMDHADTVDRGHPGRRNEQCRLANAGLTRQQQRRAIDGSLTEERSEGRQFAVATDQLAGPAVHVSHRPRPPPRPPRPQSANTSRVSWMKNV